LSTPLIQVLVTPTELSL